MDYNKIADLIERVHYAYDQYEDVARTINSHNFLVMQSSYRGKDKNEIQNVVDIQNLNFISFEEEFLKIQIEYWHNEAEKLKRKYSKLYYDVDTDDYK